MDSGIIFRIFILPLFPGLIVALFITGPHGGTIQQETWAPWIGAFVNAVVYAVGTLLIRLIWRYITSKHALQPGSHNPKETL